MSEQLDPKEIARVSERIHASLVEAMSEAMQRAHEEGETRDHILQGTVNALLNLTAFVLCDLISAEENPNSPVVQERIKRIQVALSFELHAIMDDELKKAGHPASGEFLSGQRGGHA
jgi:hypothetical protein